MAYSTYSGGSASSFSQQEPTAAPVPPAARPAASGGGDYAPGSTPTGGSDPGSGGVNYGPAPGQRPAPNIQGPYVNSAPPSGNDAGYTYTGPGADKQQKTPEQLEQEIREHQGQPDSAGVGSSGGGYKCSLGDLRIMIKQVDSMVRAARIDITQAEVISQAKPTAQDKAGSVYHADGLSKWGNELLAEVQGHVESLQNYADHLRATERNYAKQEDDTKINFRDFKGEL